MKTVDFEPNEYSDTGVTRLLKNIQTAYSLKNENIETDVFISHKQKEAGQMAAHLYTIFRDLGYSRPFLDVEADFELADLTKIIEHTKIVVIVLTQVFHLI